MGAPMGPHGAPMGPPWAPMGPMGPMGPLGATWGPQVLGSGWAFLAGALFFTKIWDFCLFLVIFGQKKS